MLTAITVAIAHCQQEDEIKEKDLPPSRRLAKAIVAEDSEKSSEEGLADLERQMADENLVCLL